MTMTKPDDFDHSTDYTVTAAGSVIGYMRGDFRQANSQIFTASEDGEWCSTGRQVADFRHSSTDAARDLFDDDAEDPDTIEAE